MSKDDRTPSVDEILMRADHLALLNRETLSVTELSLIALAQIIQRARNYIADYGDDPAGNIDRLLRGDLL